MTRGIIYIVWGNYNKRLLKRSTDSCEKYGYDYTVKVIEPRYEGLINKIEMFDSPYDTTLFLDADTEIQGNLDMGFEKAEKWGLACCIAPASSLYHASFKSVKNKIQPNDIQYNTGVIFFDRSQTVEVFKTWRMLMEMYPESKGNDQVCFSMVVNQMNPWILDNTWNYRAKIRYEGLPHGQIKILHSR